jgi:hypothetical protein
VTTWVAARDYVMLGGIPALTHFLQPGQEGQLFTSLGLIIQICTLAPDRRTACSIAEADTIGRIGVLLGSESIHIRTAAAQACKRLFASLGHVLSKDFLKFLSISKSLVDIIQLDSWRTEEDASAALWALADLGFDAADVSSELDRWYEGLVNEEGADAASGAADDLMDYVLSTEPLQWSLENVDAANLADVYGYRIEPRLIIDTRMLSRLHNDVEPSLLQETRQRAQDAVRHQAEGHTPSRSDQEGHPATLLDSDGLSGGVIDQIIAGGFGHPWSGRVRTCAKLQVELRYTFTPQPPRHQAVEVAGSSHVTLYCAPPEIRTFVNVWDNLLIPSRKLCSLTGFVGLDEDVT